MATNNQSKNRLSWEIPEHKKPERGRTWYFIASFLVLIVLFFCFFTISDWRLVFLGANSNFLFALIIIMATAIMIINENQKSLILKFTLSPEGIIIGERFYDYNQFRHFSVIYKPRQSIKQLYLDFNNSIRPRLSIPLRRMDALTVRNYLIKYLNEDLERTDPPFSEQLTRIFKL